MVEFRPFAATSHLTRRNCLTMRDLRRGDYVADAGRSDHSTFLVSSIDAVMPSTGTHGDYHKASEIAGSRGHLLNNARDVPDVRGD
jgi:hypothetical protein